jgi:type II secretory pathway component PulK
VEYVKQNLQEQLEYQEARLKHFEYLLELSKIDLENLEYKAGECRKYIQDLTTAIQKLT